MTPEAQRIAIAEACGWKRAQSKGVIIEGWLKDDSWSVHLPDFLSDLNAMHEAEKILTLEQWRPYVQELWKLGKMPKNDLGFSWELKAGYFIMLHATAAQRAEAFLRTLGLWKSS